MPLPAIVATIGSWIANNPMATAYIGKTLLGLGRGGGRGGPKRKRSGLEKGYLSHLRKISQEGVFTPGVQRNILSGVSTRLSEVSGRSKADIQGRMASQGLERSIIGTQQTRKLDRDVLERVAEVARDLSVRNRMSQVGAQERLGELGLERTREGYEDRLRRYMTRQSGLDLAMQGGVDFASALQNKFASYGDGAIIEDETGQRFIIVGGIPIPIPEQSLPQAGPGTQYLPGPT